jgi:two-component system chemotaxis response regulator CheY
MSGYNLGLFTVLIVEDNTYMRNLLRSIMMRLGAGNILTAAHGGEAIETLKLIRSDPRKAGVGSVDMVLSNWEMPPVDGLMLLRWVRRHKDSPDKFIPFVLITGHADIDKVQEARDLGATEVLGKPYSVQSLIGRLEMLIEKPRQFVLTGDHSGPDRRRRQSRSQPSDRRIMNERHVEVIYDDGHA